MFKQIFVSFAITFAVIGGMAYVKYLQISTVIAEGASRKQPPTAVTTTVVKEESWPLEIPAVGTLAPVEGAILATEELGRVQSIKFQPGAAVQKGDILVEMDTSVEEAQLRAAEAQLSMTTQEFGRQKNLQSKGASSQANLDSAEAGYRNASADVDRLKAIIARKKIIAPFSGITGVRLVNLGEVLQPGTAVVSLQSLDNLFVNFTLPQHHLGKVTSGTMLRFTVDAYPGEEFQAKVTSIDPQVDEKTRNGKLQATLVNTGQKLRSGMFVKLYVQLPSSETVIGIPSSAVLFAPYGDSVYVVEEAKDETGTVRKAARLQTVKLGRRRGDLIAVISGLKPAQEIVSSGVFKLRPGAELLVNNIVSPGTNPAPSPEDT